MRARFRALVSTARGEPLAVAVGLVLLPAMHIARHRVDVRQLGRFLAGRSPEPQRQRDSVEVGRRIAAGVFIGARVWRLADRSCVSRSVLVWALAERRGIDAHVRVGLDVERTSPSTDPVNGHAWVEVDGVAIDDTLDVATRYPPFDQPYLER